MNSVESIATRTRATTVDLNKVNYAPFESIIKKLSIAVMLVSGVAFIASVITYTVTFSGEISNDQAVWGQFGDFLGGTLNPIFGFLSLLALLTTLFIQTRELAHSTEALKEQGKQLELQAFENTLFAMVNMVNENVRSLDLGNSEPEPYLGLRAFRKMSQRLKPIYESEKKSGNITDGEKLIRDAYSRFYSRNEEYIGQYMRLLNQVFSFIDLRSPEDPITYWKILKAQISEPELLIVFYHSISKVNFLSNRDLVEKGFFENLSKKDLLDIDLHVTYLANS